MRLKALSFYLFILACLNSCSWAYTAPVPQGKELDNDKVLAIKPSMTKDEVKYLLGSPDIIDSFNPNMFIYVNTYKKTMQASDFDETRMILTFDNQDTLVGISGNYAPPTTEPVF